MAQGSCGKMKLCKMMAVAVFALCALTVQGENITIDNFQYSYNLSTKEAELTGYGGSSSHVTIPTSFSVAETYKDDDGETHTRHHTITVTSIGSSAFANKTFITSVSFHNKIKSIGSYAFRGCTGLVDVEIDSTAMNLSAASSLFEGCTWLRRVVFGDGVTALPEGWYDGPFVGCTNLARCLSARESR